MVATKHAVVGLSGGMDSGTLLGLAMDNYTEVSCIRFRYGSKHDFWEDEAAHGLADYYGVGLQHIDLSFIGELFDSTLLKSGGDIPEGHFEDPVMASTVVPCRNLIMASILAGYAESKGGGDVLMGMHAGDSAIYPDCRPQFIFALNAAIGKSVQGTVMVKAPFIRTDKGGILRYGLQRNVPYYLTRTCYKDQQLACGKCGACQERLLAFSTVNATDPLPYAV